MGENKEKIPSKYIYSCCYTQVNINILQTEGILRYFGEQIMPTVTPILTFDKYAESYIKEERRARDYM